MIGTSVLLLLVVLPGACPERAKQKPALKPLAITHVTVIDATGAPAQKDMTVVIAGNRIRRLGKAGKVAVPKGARGVDGKGKFLIPGLWDMHVHIVTREFFPLCLANGITGVRDMANMADRILNWRKQTADESIQGPRIVASGPIVDGAKPVWPFSIAAPTPSKGRAAVRTLKKCGVDFVKVYSKLTRAAYLAVAAECRNQKLPFAGHVPPSVSAAEASDAGHKSIEHLTGVVLGCSKNESKLRKEAVDAITKETTIATLMVIRAQVKALDSLSTKKTKALFARFVKNGTWQCPTLTVLRSMALLDNKQFTADPRKKYIAPFVRQFMWKPKLSAATLADNKRLFKHYLKLVGAMRKAGVKFLAGTDTPNPYCFPGFSLHDELELLVKAGLKPMEALQSATRNPAEYLGKLATQGTVAKGKIANLVLLDANPLADIRNTRKIAAVVLRGKLLTLGELHKMLAGVEKMYQPKKKP
jgi:imidazolonepropionase-like amidohydrolase